MIGVILSLFAVLVGGSILVVGARVVRKLGAAPESDIGNRAPAGAQLADGGQSPVAGSTGIDKA